MRFEDALALLSYLQDRVRKAKGNVVAITDRRLHKLRDLLAKLTNRRDVKFGKLLNYLVEAGLVVSKTVGGKRHSYTLIRDDDLWIVLERGDAELIHRLAEEMTVRKPEEFARLVRSLAEKLRGENTVQIVLAQLRQESTRATSREAALS